MNITPANEGTDNIVSYGNWTINHIVIKLDKWKIFTIQVLNRVKQQKKRR